MIFGPPGAGKGTYSARLAIMLRIESIATGDILREEVKTKTALGTKVANFVEKGQLVPDEIVIEILKKRIDGLKNKDGFILDGYPRTIEQARELDRIAEIDAVIRLIVPEWIIVDRISARRVCLNCGEVYNLKYLEPKKEDTCDKCGEHLFQRRDDKPDIVKERIEIYEKQTQPLINYYQGKVRIINIKNNQINIPPEIVIEKILKELDEAKII